MAVAGATALAELHCNNPSGRVKFHYNPETLELGKSAGWTTPTTQVSANGAVPPQFTNMPPMTLNFKMLLDKWKGAAAEGGNSPAKVIKQLLDWAKPLTTNDGGDPQPPVLTVNWGVQGIVAEVYWYIMGLTITMVMFDSDGVVTRATVAVKLQEFTGPLPPGNPTSGGIPGRRARVMTLSDTLQSIAHDEYGRPTLWRALAAANHIDDPLRLAAGTPILVPPAVQAEALG